MSIKAGVIGHPISHSKSPLIHGHWIKTHGLDGTYEAIDIDPADLEGGVRRLVDSGYAGFNVTVPHKEAMLKLCDDVDEHAAAIGAVNTVVIEGGKLCGMNTDGFGFAHNIWEAQPGFSFQDKRAVVLGAGGAARAILHALLGENVREIILLNRTRTRAEELAAHDKRITVLDWDARHEALEGADILVNTTMLGMSGQAPLDLNLEALPSAALVNDIVYAPLMTDLLRAADARGNEVVTGIGMLLHQARPAFKEWFGVMPDVDTSLRNLVLK